MRKQRKACVRCRREFPATFEAVLRHFFDYAARCAPTTRAKINENRAIFDRIGEIFYGDHSGSGRNLEKSGPSEGLKMKIHDVFHALPRNRMIF